MSRAPAGERPTAGVLESRAAAIVTAAPTYALSGERYRYRPKANVALEAMEAIERPHGMSMTEGMVEWDTTEDQAGEHRVVLEANTARGRVRQSFTVAVATSTLRASGEVVATTGGRVVAGGAGAEQLSGVGVAIPPNAIVGTTRVSVSELDRVPPIRNSAGRLRAIRFDPTGTVFSRPAIVALPLPEDAPITKERVGAFVYDTSGRWSRVPVLAVDLENRLALASAQHFSVYAAVQSTPGLTLDLSMAAPSSKCSGALMGRATLVTSLSDIEIESVQNLDDTARALLAERASIVDLIQEPSFRGSLRLVQVLELQEAGNAFVIEDALAPTTLYAPGDGSATVTHTDALGNALSQKRYPRASLALADLEKRLQGHASAVRFAAAPVPGLALGARIYFTFAPGDASLEPVDERDLGQWAFDAEPIPFASRTSDVDRDCDGVSNDFDDSDDTLRPSLEVSPRHVVSVFPDEPVSLRAHATGSSETGASEWRVLEGTSARLVTVPDAPDGRAFSASSDGRYLVSYRVGNGASQLEHVFAVDVVAAPSVNTPPRCQPTTSAPRARAGEAIGLTAVVSDAETVSSALRVEWGLYDTPTGGLAPTSLLTVGPSRARFAPTNAGTYVLGCRAFDGQLQGGVGTLEIAVDEAAKNRPPELTVSPLEAAIEVGQSVTLQSWARDQDNDVLTTKWSIEGRPVAANGTATEARLKVEGSKPGTLPVVVEVSDGVDITRTLAHVHVRDRAVTDADGDGYSAGTGASSDCNDQDASVYPGAIEGCDSRDNDCDGQTDEGGVCIVATCPTGSTADGRGGCRDVDECATGNGGCDPLTACVNTVGGRSCGRCPAGYSGEGTGQCTDVDECATNNGGCDPLVDCTNTPGGFRCGSCQVGYTGGGSIGCVDVDECKMNNGGCDPLSPCMNSVGSHSCGSCPTGYAGTGASNCVDIDECLTGNGGCGPLTRCLNVPGGRTCGGCPPGYTGSGSTGCVDINECVAIRDICDPLTTCINGPGGFQCSSCPAGYLGSGSSGCVDVDECATNNGGCDRLSKCTNTAGSFSCGSCAQGYSGTGATGCVDIDECQTDNAGCDPRVGCMNTAGSFTCGACPSGYSGGGATGCVDIDECATNNGGCDALTTCTNIPGGRTCGSCPSGYAGTGSSGCTDVNECLASTTPCSGGRLCTNKAGSFECACPKGYAFEGSSCIDIDECAASTNPCGAGAFCSNTIGSYKCGCPEGTFDEQGDGRTCSTVARIMTSNNGGCIITTGRSVHCWGGGPARKLDLGSDLVDYAPRVWAGATCAIQGGRLYCEGRNDYGEVGTGNLTSVVGLRQIGTDTDWSMLGVGYFHTCALRSNRIYCWGSNDYGQLATPLTTTLRPRPEQVGSFTDWTHVFGSTHNHACGIRNGAAYCWGYNLSGQTGSALQTAQIEVLQVGASTSWMELALGGAHTCGIRDGALYCWGQNHRGQLGISNEVDPSPITQVGTNTDWTHVSASLAQTCAIRQGTLWCWGKLGYLSQSSAPVQVEGVGWTHVACGWEHVCGVRSGIVYCWGQNQYGQLGTDTDDDSATPVRVVFR